MREMANEQATRIAKAVLFLREYEGDFNFLKDMKKRVATPGATLTPRQLAAIENCMKRGTRYNPLFDPQVLDIGIYRVPRGDVPRDDTDADIYKVQMNRQKTYKYAKRLTPIQGTRLNDDDERVKWEWEYVPRLIENIRPEHRMNEEEAKKFGLKYGICANCGRGLKQADSVERGIGPVCMKYFRF